MGLNHDRMGEFGYRLGVQIGFVLSIIVAIGPVLLVRYLGAGDVWLSLSVVWAVIFLGATNATISDIRDKKQ